MAVPKTSSGSPDDKYILVTGANSGLGFAICCRLADEFLATHPKNGSIKIIFTTRSARKAADTRQRLESHLKANAPSPEGVKRVEFVSESVNLSSLVSVRNLSRRLLETFPKLDAIILNAGLGGWSGINWFQAVFGILTDFVHQTTWPKYKIARVGAVTEKQTNADEEPALGEVFCANVLGHYMLAHNVVPLLKEANGIDGPGRIVWISSIEATKKFFNLEDIQGLRNNAPYESSKALTDILALTSNLPSTAPWAADSFLRSDDITSTKRQDSTAADNLPVTQVAHPGICATSIVPLALPLVWCMTLAFYIARVLGSPWHTVSTYIGAYAPVFLSLAPKSGLDAAEAPYQQAGGGRVKWGSGSSLFGVAACNSTETDGWGHGGIVGKPVVEADRQRRRKRGAIDLTREDKEQFEELGRQCWKQMEDLRIQWDEILDKAEGKA